MALAACTGQTGKPKEKYDINSMTHQEVSAYFANDLSGNIKLDMVFINGNKDVPYVSLSKIFKHFNQVYCALSGDTAIYEDKDMTYNSSQSEFVVNKDTKIKDLESHSEVRFDFVKNTITITDYDGFITNNVTSNPLDIADGVAGWTENSFDILCSAKDYYYVNPPVTIDLNKYNIQMYSDINDAYLPYQTCYDLFGYVIYNSGVFNGKNLVYCQSASELYTQKKDIANPSVVEYIYTDLGKKSFVDKPANYKKNKALLEFSYRELCLALDVHYGLKEVHSINCSFDEYLRANGFYERLTSAEPEVEERAYVDLTFNVFGDGHSGYDAKSPLTDPSYPSDPKYLYSHVSPDTLEMMTESTITKTIRSMYHIEPGYSEVGDTAYITFDAFTFGNEVFKSKADYYTHKDQIPNYAGLDPEKDIDVPSLLIYANQQIKRAGSPIKNIVFDLSCNGGGQSPAACMVMATIGTTYSGVGVRNTFSGARGQTLYQADLDLNHTWTEAGDTFSGYNLYCLTSRCSFSCGNLVPALMKASNQVTILGQTSGGGSCVVRNLSSATGQLFQISGEFQVCYTKNECFYDVENGATPDYRIPTKEQYYENNREFVNKLIHSTLGN